MHKDDLSPREEIVRCNVLALRKFLKLSRPEFALEIQVSVCSMKNYELGYRPVSLSYLQNIGARYGYELAGKLVEPVLLTTANFTRLIQKEVAHAA